MRFLQMNRKYFECENLRRTGKVFMHLSKIMNGTRSANQCKSHHQKMQKASKTGCIDEIIEYIEKKHLVGRVKEEYTLPNPTLGGIEHQGVGEGSITALNANNSIEIKV